MSWNYVGKHPMWHRVGDVSNLAFAALSAVAAKLAPIVSVAAGVAATIWSCIRIYEWIVSKRVPPIHKD